MRSAQILGHDIIRVMGHWTEEEVDVTLPDVAAEYRLGLILADIDKKIEAPPRRKQVRDILLSAAYVDSPYGTPKKKPALKGEVNVPAFL